MSRSAVMHRLANRCLIGGVLALLLYCAPAAAVSTPAGAPRTKEEAAKAKLPPARIELDRLKEDIGLCATMEENASRLRCYDNLSIALGLMTEEDRTQTEQSLAKFGFWSVIARTSAIGEETTSLKLDSENQVSTKSGMARNPTLIVRCKKKDTDVYLDWGSPMANKDEGIKRTLVAYTTDADPRKEEAWEYSLDYYGVFAPDSAAFIRKVRDRHKLVFEVTTDGMKRNVIFNLEGMDNALQFLIDRCYK
jgi:hypothetical protein